MIASDPSGRSAGPVGTGTLTIGTPVYNGERLLREAMEWILGQTFGDFVVVVSDNASTDRSSEIAAEYAASDSRIRLLRNRPNGLWST